MSFNDDFTGTPGQALDARPGWTKYGSGFGAGVPTINASNQLRTSTTNPDDSAFYGQEQASADHYIQFTALAQFPWTAGARTVGAIRAVDRNDYWAVSYNNTESVWELMRGTTRESSYSTAFVSGTVVKLQAVGNDIKVFLDGVERISVTDTTYNTNLRTGVVLMNATARDPVLDNYESGVMGGADVTGPNISLPTLSAVSSSSLTGGVTTNEAGPGWAVATLSTSLPSQAQIRAGQDHTGSSSGVLADTATLAVGANPGAFVFTGGTTGLTYYMHVSQDDTASPANPSNRISSSGVTLPAPVDPPVITITSLEVSGQSATIEGTYTGTPSAGSATLAVNSPANGAVAQGPIAVVYGAGTFSVTFDDIVPGSYLRAAITLSNTSGSATEYTPAFEVLGIDGDPEGSTGEPPVTPTGRRRIILIS